jgi:Concanavalin A-like lectin/glucanases superfamily
MRAAALPFLVLPLFFINCGSKADLIIGELQGVSTAGSASMLPSAGKGAEASAAGTAQGATGGTAVAGSGAAPSEGGAGGTGMAGEGGASDVPGGASGTCPVGEEPPLGSLVHRYSFDGTGTSVVDSVGTANGNLVGGATLDGSGVLTLPGNRDGQPDQYLDLPNGLISKLEGVTIVAWTTWLGGAGYQRVLDFGASDLGEAQGNSGKSYVAVMPSTGFANGTGLGAEIAAPGSATLQLPSPENMLNRSAQVAFAFQSGVSLELMLDGKSLIRSSTSLQLSDINDVNNWVGESQWSKDHCYHGTFDELRIYNVALTACQLQTLYDRGPATP